MLCPQESLYRWWGDDDLYLPVMCLMLSYRLSVCRRHLWLVRILLLLIAAWLSWSRISSSALAQTTWEEKAMKFNRPYNLIWYRNISKSCRDMVWGLLSVTLWNVYSCSSWHDFSDLAATPVWVFYVILLCLLKFNRLPIAVMIIFAWTTHFNVQWNAGEFWT